MWAVDVFTLACDTIGQSPVDNALNGQSEEMGKRMQTCHTPVLTLLISKTGGIQESASSFSLAFHQSHNIME